jgi:peptidoglycan hydrolase CwlO-like protein
MNISNDDIKKLRSRFLEETKTIRNQIDNKKAKIEQEQKTLRNHQKRYDEKLTEYENEVNNLITKLVLRNGVDTNQAKSIYNYLMEGNSNGTESEN